MIRRAVLALALSPALPIRAQSAPVAAQSSTPQTLNASSTLVVVPALIRNQSGDVIYTLKASDFTLTDDGVPQKLHLESESGTEPLALVVDIEGGKSAVRNIGKFQAIAPMLDAIVGNVPHRIAVVGFDSSPVLVTPFTADTTQAEYGIDDLLADNNGDGGAAILDSLDFSVNLLRSQPPQYRRAILLISETNGDTSKLKMQDAVRAISDTNTIIYSIGFSTGKSKDGEIWHGLRNNTSTLGSGAASFSLQPEVEMLRMALTLVIDSLRRNIPETVANLTGGEYLQFLSQKGLARDLQTVSNHVPNRYVLSFQPQSQNPGFHSVQLTVPRYANLRISARNGYWAEAPAQSIKPALPNH